MCAALRPGRPRAKRWTRTRRRPRTTTEQQRVLSGLRNALPLLWCRHRRRRRRIRVARRGAKRTRGAVALQTRVALVLQHVRSVMRGVLPCRRRRRRRCRCRRRCRRHRVARRFAACARGEGALQTCDGGIALREQQRCSRRALPHACRQARWAVRRRSRWMTCRVTTCLCRLTVLRRDCQEGRRRPENCPCRKC